MIDSGFLGHVRPPWFAPQFPVISASNKKAVAANDVLQRHYGQKFVYGHMRTNSGRRVVAQITFDAMSVHKPLLGRSALQRQGVTIMSNLCYDRIIFQSDAANLVSHDCHSYLHADGTPLYRVMVMIAENVPNDVDEEVCAGDGDEVPEAREASDGHQRAIADADHAGQLGISDGT